MLKSKSSKSAAARRQVSILYQVRLVGTLAEHLAFGFELVGILDLYTKVSTIKKLLQRRNVPRMRGSRAKTS